MLKLLQEGVNKGSRRMEAKKPSQQRKDLAGGLAKKQGRIEELTRKLARKLQKEEDPDAGGDEDR